MKYSYHPHGIPIQKPSIRKCIHNEMLTEIEENKMIYKSHIHQSFFRQ